MYEILLKVIFSQLYWLLHRVRYGSFIKCVNLLEKIIMICDTTLFLFRDV